MSTNYGHSEGPEDRDRTTAPSGNGSPTEPIRGANPTEPIRGASPTEPNAGTAPTEPIRGADRTQPTGPAARPPSTSGATLAAPPDWTTTGEPANSEDDADRQGRPRVGTIVWGLIVIALAVVLILAELATLSLDMGQVVIGLLIGAGLALVVGGVISASNREKDDKHP